MRKILKEYGLVMSMLLALVGLVVLIMYSANNYIKSAKQLTEAKQANQQLKDKIGIIQANQSLTQSQLTEYNRMLSELIPQKEDYFSILYALETLSQQTGFVISKYSIDLTSSTSNKLALIVDGDGDADSFLHFLENYQFAGGRLITNEKIEYQADKIGQIEISLNFYNKKEDTSTNQEIAIIPAEQIALMNKIQQKLTVTYKGSDSIPTDYDTKPNPF